VEDRRRLRRQPLPLLALEAQAAARDVGGDHLQPVRGLPPGPLDHARLDEGRDPQVRVPLEQPRHEPAADEPREARDHRQAIAHGREP
jgi:hypothetical protein